MIGMGIPTSQSKTERIQQTSKLTFAFNNLLAFVWFRARDEVNLRRKSAAGKRAAGAMSATGRRLASSNDR